MMRSLLAVFAVSCAALCGSCFPQSECGGQSVWEEFCKPGDANCTGNLINANEWQSGSMTGDWLDFKAQKNWFMHLRDGVTGAQLQGTVVTVQVLVSPVQRPNDGNQFAIASGNLAELGLFVDGSGWASNVKNDTCADYFVYVYVRTAP